MKKAILAAVVIAAGMSASAGKTEMADIFADGMVLQRDREVPVWGFADPGRRVTVGFAGQRKAAVAGTNGEWRVDLEPMGACREGRELTIDGEVALRDVLVGEVWLASGQSNMNLDLFHNPADGAYVGGHANQALDMGYVEGMIANRPLVRCCLVPFQWKKTPVRRLKERAEWKTMKDGNTLVFPALPFHFARLIEEAVGVPVGIVAAAWGNSNIIGFIPQEGYRSVAGLEEEAEKELDDLGPVGYKGAHYGYNQPRAIWNGRYAPIVPFAIRGVIWYQGEANVGDRKYGKYLEALWNGWSRAFENAELPFFAVQVAPFGDSRKPGYPECSIWKAVNDFIASRPVAGVVTTIDLGEEFNIHPAGKRTIALRLAAEALGRVYGRSDIRWQSPRFVCATAGTNGTVSVKASHTCKWMLHNRLEAPFELAGEDGQFKPAQAEFRPEGVVVLRAEGVERPRKVRYAWSRLACGRLMNEYGFPLHPFDEAVKVNEKGK